MKLVVAGRPEEFFRWTHDRLNVDIFIEGGTYRGDTAAWAAGVFRRVVTIELSGELHEQASARYADRKNIEFRRGDTRGTLRELVPQLEGPALFWLDAHWSTGKTAGREDQCPILEEIALINQSPQEHFIVIDDARLFTAPPPPPLRVEQWPDIWRIEKELQKGPFPRYVIITRDMIVAAPKKHESAVASFWQNKRPERPALHALVRAFIESVLPPRLQGAIKEILRPSLPA
jgi:hypothetical protein